MRRLALSCSVATLLAATAVAAQDEGRFALWDEDGDGVLTEEEFTAGAEDAGLFDTWDENNDDVLSDDELNTGLFELWDTDGDDQLSTAEWDQGIDRWAGEQAVDLEFAAWDEDGNGSLSREEFTDQIGQVGLFGDQDGAQPGAPEGETAALEGDAGAATEPSAGGDSVIDQDEFMLGLFDWVDEDDDNQVAPEEFGVLNDVFPE